MCNIQQETPRNAFPNEDPPSGCVSSDWKTCMTAVEHPDNGAHKILAGGYFRGWKIVWVVI